MDTILIVEDSIDILKALNDILSAANYKTVLAHDGEEALAKIKMIKPDLIISGIIMPNCDGYQLYEHVNKDKNLSNIPFIFITAKSGSKNFRHGMNIGADDYIIKPFHIKEVLTSINFRLEKKKYFDERLNEIKENIALYVPHELRTPLVPIMGITEILENEAGNLSPNEIKEMANSIYSSADRLHETIEKFITYSEVFLNDSKAKKYYCSSRISPSHLEDFIRVLVTERAEKYNRCGDVSVSFEKRDESFSQFSIQKIFIQLIDNALKFSEFGTKIIITGIQLENKFLFKIEDHGFGMSEEQIAKLDAFVQINRKSKQQMGNGLGLAIVKIIIQNNNGSITIKSKKGSGTIVEFSLPSVNYYASNKLETEYIKIGT